MNRTTPPIAYEQPCKIIAHYYSFPIVLDTQLYPFARYSRPLRQWLEAIQRGLEAVKLSSIDHGLTQHSWSEHSWSEHLCGIVKRKNMVPIHFKCQCVCQVCNCFGIPIETNFGQANQSAKKTSLNNLTNITDFNYNDPE